MARLLLAGFLLLCLISTIQVVHSGQLEVPWDRFLVDLGNAFPWDGPFSTGERIATALDSFGDGVERETRIVRGFERHWQQGLVALGSGNETVHVGFHGWLEYRPSFDYTVGKPFLDPSDVGRLDVREALTAFAKDLRDLGIVLYLVPIPGKVMVHPEMFTPGVFDGTDLHNVSFVQLRRDLEAAGIRVVDLQPELRELAHGQKAFLATDSHWAPFGIDGAAAVIARELGEAKLLSPRTRVYRRQSLPFDHYGDLVRMLGLRNGDFPVERIQLLKVYRPDGQPFEIEGQAEVLVLGDSFSNMWTPADSLPAQIAFHLGRPVDAIIREGGAATWVRDALAAQIRNDPQRYSKTRVIVYEFSARELAASRWEVTNLPKRPTAKPDPPNTGL